MKNKQWNPQANGNDTNVATMPAPVPPPNDAAFDKLRYQPTLRTMPPPVHVAQQTSLPAGPNATIQAINEEVRNASAWVTPLRQQIGRVIIGQHHLVDRLLVGLITNGHLLLEGVPGLAKTPRSQDAGGGHKGQIPAVAIHAGHAARRHRGHDDL